MRISGRLTGALVLCALLGACQFPTLPFVRETPPGIPSSTANGYKGPDLHPAPNLLKYYEWLHEQSQDIQRREYDTSRANFDADPNTLNRLRLALVLCLPGAPFRDYGTAAGLMTGLLADSPDARVEDRGLAYLILGFAEQNRRTQRERSATQQRLVDERQTRETLEERVKDLEITVEQLKAIEDSLMETEQSINVPAPPAATND